MVEERGNLVLMHVMGSVAAEAARAQELAVEPFRRGELHRGTMWNRIQKEQDVMKRLGCD